MFNKYIEYLKDNPEGYWFKRKLYGWGWVPATREGWFVIGVYVLFLINFALSFKGVVVSEKNPIQIVSPIIIATIILIVICYRKGESPRWQWGKPVEKS